MPKVKRVKITEGHTRDIKVAPADIRMVMNRPGRALITVTGEGTGPNGVKMAALRAMDHPLLATHITEAGGVLLRARGGPSMTIDQVESIRDFIWSKQRKVGADSAIIFFEMEYDENMGDRAQITITATGIP